MPPIDFLPVPLQTIYAELVDRAWTGDIAELMAAGGSAYARTVNGRQYWYWQPPGRVSARYLGPDSEDLRARVQEQKDLAAIKRERTNLVRALRSANMPAPDRRSGAVLAALAGTGAFHGRTLLVGSMAFQTYLPLLGVRLPASLSATDDVGTRLFHSISIAAEDKIDADLLAVLRTVDHRFEAVPSPLDERNALRYVIRDGSQKEFSVDILCPLREPIRDRITTLKARCDDVQFMHLDFLLPHEVNAVALYGPGIPVNVPAPERYALHKLIVSQTRADMPCSQATARKDLQQADALIRVLASDRPHDLEEAWTELRQRGPSWRRKADRAVAALSSDTRVILER